MKIKLIMLASLLVVASAYTSVAQVGPPTPNSPASAKDVPNKPPPTISTLPDLVVLSIKADDLDSGEVSVLIKNQGQRLAGRSDVELSVTYGSQPPVSIVHSAIPLQPGQTAIVMIDMKKSIVQAKFCATVDSLNKVAESNENNNKRCGQFGGKP